MDEETSEFVNAVLGNDMLRELILDFAIHQTKDTICRKTLCNTRQVQKCWKLSVSDFMRKNKEPLYKLVLDGNNSISGTPYVEERGKILEQFLNFINNCNETFCLLIKPQFFRLENYQSFLAVLHQANTKLVELNMLVPTNGGSLPCTFPNVNLQNLQKFSVHLTEQSLDNLEIESAAFYNPLNIHFLLQSILSRSESLKILYVQQHYNALPGFQYILLPKTITRLNLNCLLSDQEMESLVQTKFPCLEVLTLTVPNRALREGLLSEILNNFCSTLKYLYFRGNGSTNLSPLQYITNPINFPVMKKLINLRMASINIEIDSGSASRLDKCFPQLQLLECFQTEDIFRPWTIPSNNLEYVNTLTLFFVNLRESENIIKLPSVEILQGVKQSMPNVKNMTLVLREDGTQELQKLLNEMGHLRSLRIYLRMANIVRDSNLWDSFLTGIPVDIVANLRANPSYWDNLEVKMDDKPNITVLKNLQALSLDTMPTPGTDQETMESLISPLAFKFALNKMTNLRILNLIGRFKATRDIIEEWRAQGRKITYVQKGQPKNFEVY